MGLLQNGFRDRVGVYRIYGAGVSNGAYPYTLVGNRHLTGMQRNMTMGEGITSKQAGIPIGHLAPSSWSLPQKPGRMACKTACTGGSNLNVDMAAGIGIEGTASGACTASGSIAGLAWVMGSALGDSDASGSLSGYGYMTGSAEGDSLATGDIFAAVAIQGLAAGSSDVIGTGYLAVSASGMASGSSSLNVSLAALLSISGTASGSSSTSGTLTGGYFASGVAAGSSTVSGVCPIGYGWLSGSANGDSDGSAQPFATGFMNGSTTTSSGELTADQVASAVWGSVRAEYLVDSAGYMQKIVTNKRGLVKEASGWALIVYDDDGTTPILKKALKDKDGAAISDIAAGIMATEEASAA